MPKDTYRGDSAGKKITRARLWLAAANWMRNFGAPYYGSLVLTGHGGDISTLKGWGFKPESISAVDRVHSLTTAAGAKHPRCFLATGDVDQIAQHRKYNAVHLDFCNGLTVENILTVAEVVRSAPVVPMWLGVTFLKGRGQNESRSPLVPDLSRSERKARKRLYIDQDNTVAASLMSHGVFDHGLLRKLGEKRLRRYMPPSSDLAGIGPSNRVYDKHCRLTPLGRALIRADILRQAVMAQLHEEEIILRPLVVYSYHSGVGKRGSGTPFVTVGYVVYPQVLDEHIRKTTLECGALMRFEQLPTDLGLRGLKHCALDLLAGYDVRQVAQILDIKPGTVNAWKAHDTMGTYRPEMAEMAENCIGFTSYDGNTVQCELGWGQTEGGGKGIERSKIMDFMKQRRLARINGAGRHSHLGGDNVIEDK